MADLQTNVIKEEAREGTVISDGKELRNFDESYREKYQTNVLPAIKQALKDDWLNVRLEKKYVSTQRNQFYTGHCGCSWSWSCDPNFFVPPCLSLALASTPPPICGRGCLPLPSLCLIARGAIISSSSYSGFQHHIFIEFFSGFQNHFFTELFWLSKSRFQLNSYLFAALDPAGRTEDVQRLKEVREGSVDVVALADSSPRK